MERQGRGGAAGSLPSLCTMLGVARPGQMRLVAQQLGLEQDRFGGHRPSIKWCGKHGWGCILTSSLTCFCSTRLLTYLKHSSRTTTSLWTISLLQLESSPQGVSAPSQRESHGPRWVTVTWSEASAGSWLTDTSSLPVLSVRTAVPRPAWLCVRATHELLNNSASESVSRHGLENILKKPTSSYKQAGFKVCT